MAESKALCKSTAEADDQWLHSKAFPELATDFAAHLPQWVARHALGIFLQRAVFFEDLGNVRCFVGKSALEHLWKTLQKMETYCWWKITCTSWYVVYLIIYKVLYISGGARFLPSPVSRHIPEKLDNSSTGSPGLGGFFQVTPFGGRQSCDDCMVENSENYHG